MNDSQTSRSIELSVEVPGTPEEVWRAIATGPGISAWYVPTTLDEREGGGMSLDFGTGPIVEGQIQRWEPPTAFAYGASDESEAGDVSMFFEFFVETRDGGGCVVRLVNSGFGWGGDWDDQYDAMTEGWKLFLHNLVLHLTHFAGRTSRSLIALGFAADTASGWDAYTSALGLPAAPAVGDKVATTGGPEPRLAGEVERVTPNMITLLTSEPAEGVALLAVEGSMVSLFLYLYGDDGEAFADGAGAAAWTAWMNERFPMPVG